MTLELLYAPPVTILAWTVRRLQLHALLATLRGLLLEAPASATRVFTILEYPPAALVPISA